MCLWVEETGSFHVRQPGTHGAGAKRVRLQGGTQGARIKEASVQQGERGQRAGSEKVFALW